MKCIISARIGHGQRVVEICAEARVGMQAALIVAVNAIGGHLQVVVVVAATLLIHRRHRDRRGHVHARQALVVRRHGGAAGGQTRRRRRRDEAERVGVVVIEDVRSCVRGEQRCQQRHVHGEIDEADEKCRWLDLQAA